MTLISGPGLVSVRLLEGVRLIGGPLNRGFTVLHTSRRISKTCGSKNPTKTLFQTAWLERFKGLHHYERRDSE